VPSVAQLATVPAIHGGNPSTSAAAYAQADMATYDRIVSTVYAFSGDAYPTDSIAMRTRVRATQWLQWIDQHGVGETSYSVRRLVAEARLAVTAGDVPRSHRVVEQGIVATAKEPARQSYVLSAAVAAWVKQGRCDLAEPYAVALDHLPKSGYASKRDSVSVLYRQYEAHTMLVRGYFRSGADVTRLLAHGESALTILGILKGGERYNNFTGYPYTEVALALSGRSDARARLAAMNQRLMAYMHQTAVDEPDPAARARAENWMVTQMRMELRRYALLGEKAPPLVAHAWLNTPDSTYRAIPHTKRLADDTIRVLDFGTLWCHGCQMALPALGRLQRRFAGRVQVIFVTNNEGHAGVDLADADAEVTWLKSYYVGKAHVPVPIALWVGAKQAADYDGVLPVKSPVYDAYAITGFPTVAVVDGHGVVRAYAELSTREAEDDAAKLVQYLLSESEHSTPWEMAGDHSPRS